MRGSLFHNGAASQHTAVKSVGLQTGETPVSSKQIPLRPARRAAWCLRPGAENNNNTQRPPTRKPMRTSGLEDVGTCDKFHAEPASRTNSLLNKVHTRDNFIALVSREMLLVSENGI